MITISKCIRRLRSTVNNPNNKDNYSSLFNYVMTATVGEYNLVLTTHMTVTHQPLRYACHTLSAEPNKIICIFSVFMVTLFSKEVRPFSLLIQHLKQPQPPRSVDGSCMLDVVELFSPTASWKYTCVSRRQ
jgi:hypothetical protein